MEALWRETTVGDRGEVVLEGLPFGQPVEVVVLSKAAASEAASRRNLRGSVLEFLGPLEPVAGDDWWST
jgi:hypothetical protein